MGVTLRTRVGDVGLLLGWALAVGIVQAGQPGETDPMWQVRDGLEILAGRGIAAVDTWGWGMEPGVYFPNSPGWNVILGLAWEGGGFAGTFVLTVASVVTYALAAAWAGRTAGARSIPVVMSFLAVTVVAVSGMSARATLPAESLVLVSLVLGYRLGRWASGRGPSVSVLSAAGLGISCSAIGNWIHVSWATWALVVGAAWTVLWLLESRLTRRRAVAMALAALAGAAVGILLGPYGAQVRLRSTAVMEVGRGLISEWSPAWHPESRLVWMPLSILAVAIAAVLLAWGVKTVRNTPGRALVVATALISFLTAVAGLLAIRFTVVAWLTLAPAIAAGLTSLLDRWHGSSVRRDEAEGREGSRRAEWTSDGFWRTVLALCLAVFAPVAIFLATPLGRPPSWDVVAALPEGCRMFSHPSDAAAVLLLRPDVRVWIDGRADYWGRARILAYGDFVAESSYDLALPAGTTCVLMSRESRDGVLAPLADRLDAGTNWARAADGPLATVWTLSGPAAPTHD